MKIRSLFAKSLLLILCAGSLFSGAKAQKPGNNVPRQEKLLNGLKLLMWTDPAATDVKISIRVHSGSAFDPQGKEGVMQLLADNIFPSAVSKTFFSEDLGGSVEVITTYDYIQINATAKPASFIDLVQTLAQTVSNPTIDKDTTATLKKALSEKLKLLERDPAYVADQAAAKRLFGTFPYGRPQMGSVESIQRIDFADLLFAKGRFLSADNATVMIGGNFNSDLGFRAARRYFGAWLKSDKRVPSTFRQPDDPDTKMLEITLDSAPARTTFALRGFARNDPDYAASLVLENILKSRLQKNGTAVTLSQSARALPGVLVVSLPGATGFPFKSFSEKISESEFAQARLEAAAEISRKTLFDQWLDVDTYHTKVTSDAGALQNVTVADVQRVADRLARNPVVSVLLKSPAAQ
ncbi:MAG: pitrilysin family protein [Acidobacteriota bacterium]